MHMFIENQRQTTNSYTTRTDPGECAGRVIMFIAQVRGGKAIDQEVFLDVYDTIQRWFSSMVYTGVEEEYLDIIDEAVTRFIEKGREFRGDSVGEFYNYMRTIIRNLITDDARRAARVRGGDVDDMTGDARAHLAREVEVNHEYEALYSCIETLSPTLRGIIYEVLAGRRKKSIAEEFGISPSLLSQNLQKAFQFLRGCLSGKGYSAELAL